MENLKYEDEDLDMNYQNLTFNGNPVLFTEIEG